MNFPKLRFKEFNDESYRKDILKNIISYIADNRGKNPDYYLDSGIPVIDNFMIQNQGYPDLSRANRYIDDNIYKNFIRKAIEYNDTLITLVGNGIGNICLTPKEKCVIIQNTLGLRTNKFNDKKYLYHLLTYKNSEIKKLDRGMAQPSIRQDELLKLEVTIPNINEQLKISNFLSLLDKKIELQSKKIEDLKLFKKGLINVLNKKSYQETALGKIGKFQTSSIDKLVKENEKIVNLYNYMDVYKHKILMTQDLRKLSKTSAKDNQITINNLKRGDILFTPSSETPDDIGHSICIQEDLPNTVYSYHLLRYRPNIIMDPLFSNYYFNNSKIRKQIIRYSTGATRYTISLDSFLKIKVDIPDLITQKKYGLLLYSTDKKVNKELFKLNKLQELKKGLIQDMFV